MAKQRFISGKSSDQTLREAKGKGEKTGVTGKGHHRGSTQKLRGSSFWKPGRKKKAVPAANRLTTGHGIDSVIKRLDKDAKITRGGGGGIAINPKIGGGQVGVSRHTPWRKKRIVH
jgi:hypothetical protein